MRGAFGRYGEDGSRHKELQRSLIVLIGVLAHLTMNGSVTQIPRAPEDTLFILGYGDGESIT